MTDWIFQSEFLISLLIFLCLATAAFFWFRRKRLSPVPIESISDLIPESNFLQLGDLKIHYIQAGEGDDLVLIHGIGASTFTWRLLFPLLQGRYRVTALDLPGFGLSSKPAARDYGLDAQSEIMAETLTRLGIKSAILIGSSMGGAISLWMSKHYPDRFKKVITLAPATNSSVVPTQLRHLAIASPLLRRALNRTFVKRMIRRVVSDQKLVTDAVVEAYMRPFIEEHGSGVRSFWSAMSLLSDRRLPRELTGLEADVLVIYGARDLLVTKRSIDKLMRILPDAQLIVHERGGHHLMEDDPDWTAKRIEEFVSGLTIPKK
jgi:pimeloyl-ACP methyl ester carboxylesterase